MTFLIEVYEKNKALDAKFENNFGNSEEIIQKNILEFIVEIAEFTNETKCFKYWSNKAIDKEAALEELADCLIMNLYLFQLKEKSLDFDYEKCTATDLNQLFLKLFNIASSINLNIQEKLIEQTLTLLVHIGELLGFSRKDISNACLNKINKVYERFNTNEYRNTPNN